MEWSQQPCVPVPFVVFNFERRVDFNLVSASSTSTFMPHSFDDAYSRFRTVCKMGLQVEIVPSRYGAYSG
jgi:hypothetical protein